MLSLCVQVDMAAAQCRRHVDLIKVRHSRAEWGSTDQDQGSVGIPERTLRDLHAEFHDASESFRRRQQDFVHLLATQAHVDLKHLIFRLDV